MTTVFANSSPIQTGSPRPKRSNRITLSLIWVYFILLIFEGSFRKWFLPQYSSVLLLIRDPVVIAIYLAALKEGCYPHGGFLRSLYIIAILSVAASAVASQAGMLVTLYGFRANFLHLPLIFVMGEVLTRRDLKQIGFAILILSVPVAILMLLQFSQPEDSFLNRGTLGTGSMQIGAVVGHIRPAAFFSYNTGAGQYLSILGAIIIFGLMARTYPLWLIYTGAVSLLLASAVSGSRTTATELIFLTLALCALWIIKPKVVGRLPAVLLGLVFIYFIAQLFSIFHEGLAALQQRSNDAFESEPFLSRMAYCFRLPLTSAQFLGAGLGLGTNVGAAASGGQMTFILAEAEWPRHVLESGPILGTAFVIWRVALAVYLGLAAYAAVRRDYFLAWLMQTAAIPIVISGNLGQATSLGFVVFSSGLCLAAAQAAPEDPNTLPPPESRTEPEPHVPLRRGRSPYAERLHTGSA